MPKGVYVRTEEHNRKNREAQKISQNKSGVREKKRDSHKRNRRNEGPKPEGFSEKYKGNKNPMRRLEVREKFKGEGNPSWKGGLYGYYHEKARELFGSPVCQKCGISLEEYRLTHKVKKQFEMHCLSNDYTILEQWNWQCICVKCHHKIHIHYD